MDGPNFRIERFFDVGFWLINVAYTRRGNCGEHSAGEDICQGTEEAALAQGRPSSRSKKRTLAVTASIEEVATCSVLLEEEAEAAAKG